MPPLVFPSHSLSILSSPIAIGTIIANLQVLKASKANISKDFLKKGPSREASSIFTLARALYLPYTSHSGENYSESPHPVGLPGMRSPTRGMVLSRWGRIPGSPTKMRTSPV